MKYTKTKLEREIQILEIALVVLYPLSLGALVTAVILWCMALNL